jgi:1-acyl-sn-glycerol-3-phosphate acyltransferase
VIYHFLRSISWFICKVLFNIKTEGIGKLPADNKIIIAVNHASYLDPIALGAVIPKKIRWVIRKDVYSVWWLKWLFFLTGMIPENGAVGSSLSCLENGDTIGVFPEGTRSWDGNLQDGKRGVAVLALKTGAIVVPCAIRGSFDAYPRTALLPRPRPVKVIIGSPLKFEKVETPEEKMINSALDKIMSAIGSLIDSGDTSIRGKI